MLDTVPVTDQVLHIALDELMPDPNQPRRTFLPEELERLKLSVAARGVLQPLRVAYDEERLKWRIIIGESRWRAARLAGLATVPCLPISGQPTETDILADQLIENSVRCALPPLQFARGLVKLQALRKASAGQLGEELGLSGAAVTRAKALLKLPLDIQVQVDDGRITESAAYVISRLDDEADMREMAAELASKRMTRDQAAQAVKEKLSPKGTGGKPGRVTYRKPDTGVSVVVSGGGKPLTVKALLDAIDRVRQAAGKLREDADLSELMKLLKPL